MDERFLAFSCNKIDKKRMKDKFPRKTILTTLSIEQDISKLPALGHFYLALILFLYPAPLWKLRGRMFFAQVLL